ncbi:hypothetical protein BJ170DRAFT_600366 [Xylariales sp. AK1849]|nr:hypothetical protein BJ170DRAFT_600366 [Xylariales sp. AK1849]
MASTLGSFATLPEDPEIIYISDDGTDESGMEDADYDFDDVKLEADSVDDNDNDNYPHNAHGISAIEELAGGDTDSEIGAVYANSSTVLPVPPNCQLVAQELAALCASLSRTEAEIHYNSIPGEPSTTTSHVKRKRDGLGSPLCGRKGFQPPSKRARRFEGRVGCWSDVYIRIEKIICHIGDFPQDFTWDRHRRTWRIADEDIWDSEDLGCNVLGGLPFFLVVVRPCADGFPISLSYDEDREMFAGFDDMCRKRIQVTSDGMAELFANPDYGVIIG